MSDLHPGDQLDHYRIDGLVARSGMASIFRGTDTRDGKSVAIKIPHEEMEADPILFDRFEREADIGKKLDHPGVVRVYGDPDRSRRYMVLEWVDGRLLRQILNEKKKASAGTRHQDHAGAVQGSRLHPLAGSGAPRFET